MTPDRIEKLVRKTLRSLIRNGSLALGCRDSEVVVGIKRAITTAVKETQAEQRERDAGKVEGITLKDGPNLIPDYNSDFVKGWNAALGNAQESIRDGQD